MCNKKKGFQTKRVTVRVRFFFVKDAFCPVLSLQLVTFVLEISRTCCFKLVLLHVLWKPVRVGLRIPINENRTCVRSALACLALQCLCDGRAFCLTLACNFVLEVSPAFLFSTCCSLGWHGLVWNFNGNFFFKYVRGLPCCNPAVR